MEAFYGSSRLANVDGRVVRFAAEVARDLAIPSGPDARTAFSMQPGLRRLWKNPASQQRAEEKSRGVRVLSGRR